MHFQIFIPDCSNAAEGLNAVGLPYLATGMVQQSVLEGPTGGPGQLIAWRNNRGAVSLKFSPDAQAWLPAVADQSEQQAPGRYWVGIWKDSPPTPADLERARPYAGPRVILGDGQSWLLPPLMELPHTMTRADDDEIMFTPDFFLHRLQLAAVEWLGAIRKLQESDCPLAPANLFGGTGAIWPELREFVELGLMANYRLTPEVADYLRLWSTTKTGTVWKAVLALLPDPVEVGDDG